MEITTYSAQVSVRDTKGSCGVNINRICSGYVAELHFWGDAIYVARRTGDSALYILIVPCAKWKDSIRNEGFEIIGKLSRLANGADQPRAEDKRYRLNPETNEVFLCPNNQDQPREE